MLTTQFTIRVAVAVPEEIETAWKAYLETDDADAYTTVRQWQEETAQCFSAIRTDHVVENSFINGDVEFETNAGFWE